MSKYVALFQDTMFDSWPQRAEEEYIRQYSREAYDNMEDGEAALWLGTWLHEHEDEIPAVADYPEYDIKLGSIYRYENDDIFFWIEKDSDGTENICKVKVEEIPDGVAWTLDNDNGYCMEFVNVYYKPDANGFLRYMSRKEREEILYEQ